MLDAQNLSLWFTGVSALDSSASEIAVLVFLSCWKNLGPIFALFVPFYFSVPSVQVVQILGRFSITNKTLVYIMGLQLLTSSMTTWILAFSGLLSGIVYHYNVLKVQRLLCVPKWVTRCASFILEPLFSSADPTDEAPIGMGATLEIQRQQRMEMLDQQIMLAQLNQNNRRHQWQGGLINWNRLFPPMRNRFPANNQHQESGLNRPSTAAPVSEEQGNVSIIGSASNCCPFLIVLKKAVMRWRG
ncbi:ubiquitin-associated domain-containing protein 2 [Rhincodon typus]|uniref:ubiquitin-associated domain-containing protein 2 n=1 Tax=Rhincodon typus TaxID=259920 RepID=UPI00202E8BD3|nr:ubiquitin-associated domain-containing protein 2 [Rhincodon typus]